MGLPTVGRPVAAGHEDGPVRPSRSADNPRAAGALAASADDLDDLFHAIMSGVAVPPEAWETASATWVDRDQGLYYGLGITVDEANDRLGHRGLVLGHTAAWRHDRSRDATLLLAVNSSDNSTTGIEDAAWEIFEAHGYFD